MGKLIETTIKFPDLLKRFKGAEQRIGRFIAAQIQTNRGMLFDAEGAHNDHKGWKPPKYREGQILSLTGTLRKSMAPPGAKGFPGPMGIVRISGTLARKEVGVGTTLAYAPMMNWGTAKLPGGVLRPKQKSVLRFKVGGHWVFAQRVRIPARRFDQWNATDKAELTVALHGLITRILNGG